MKKRILALVLVLGMILSVAAQAAHYDNKEKTADALNELGLILGNGSGYNLDGLMQRDAGTTMLIRMLGAEDAASKGGDFGMPFKDVPAWARGYVGYGWKHHIVNGVSAERFAPTGTMTDYMFLTLTLRALGYTDSGETPQFVWNDPYALAQRAGLIVSVASDSHFTRGEAILIFWNALEAELVGKDMTLAESLIKQGVFSWSEYQAAKEIQKNGRNENQGVPIQPEIPSQPGVGITYEEFKDMTGAEQQALMESFESDSAFFEWLDKVQAEYEESRDHIDVGADGSFDIGDYISGKN